MGELGFAAILSGGQSKAILEELGEVVDVVITEIGGNTLDGLIRRAEILGGGTHADLNQVLLGGVAGELMKPPSKMHGG